MEERLQELVLKVYDNNPGRLLTPEQIFAEYVEYYKGYDIKIEPERLKNYIYYFFEDGSISDEVFPMHKLKLDNLTKEEYDYFYLRLNEIFKKIYDATDDSMLKDYLKYWLNL